MIYIIALGLIALGQDPDVPAGRQLDRLERIVYQNPRPGTAFELWMRGSVDAGGLDELVERVRARAGGEADDASAQLVWAMVCLRLGRLDQASVALDHAVLLAPRNFQPLILQSEIAVRRGEPGEAAARIEAAVELPMPLDQWLAVHRQLGRLYVGLGRADDAARTWTLIADRFPDDVDVLAELAELLTDESHDELGIAMWRRVARLAASDPFRRIAAEIEVAQLQWRRGDRGPSLESFNRVLDDLRPDSWQARDVRRRIEDLFLGTQDVAGMIEYCQAELARRPDDLEARRMHARAISLAGRHVESADCYAQMIERAPGRRDLRERFISECLRAGRPGEALSAAHELVAQFPNDVAAAKWLGELCVTPSLDHPDPAAAIRAWQSMAGIRSDDPALCVMAADACRLAANAAPDDQPARHILLDAAEDFYKQAINRSPTRPELYEYLGKFQHSVGRTGDAKTAWRRMARLPAESGESWRRVAELYAAHDLIDDAIEAHRHAVLLEPRDFHGLDQYIARLVEGDRFAEADESCERLRELAETDEQIVQANARRVDVWDRRGQLDAKIEAYAERARQSQLSAGDRILYASLLDRGGRFADAALELERVLRDEGESVMVIRLYVDLLCRANEAVPAISQLDRLVQLEPRRALEYQRRIVELELGLNRPTEARAAAQRLVELAGGNPASHRMAAAVSRRFGSPREVVDALRQATMLAPRDTELRLELASALNAMGRREEATQHYWRSLEMTRRQSDREAIVATLCRIAASPPQWQLLIDRLELARRREDDPKSLTRCIVFALRRMGDRGAASRELDRAIAHAPNDLDYLRLKVELLEEQSAWLAAVAIQSRLVELSQTTSDLDRLATLLDLAGEHDRAAAVIARLMRDAADDQAVAAVVQSHVRHGEFTRAREVLRFGFERWPDSWLLRWHSGMLHIFRQETNEGVDDFRQLVFIELAPAESTAGDANPVELEEFEAARRVANELTQLGRRWLSQNLGSRAPVTLSPVIDQRLARSFGAVALFQYAPVEMIESLVSEPQVSPDVLRVLLAGASATGHESLESIAGRLARVAPLDPSPHIARIRTNLIHRLPRPEDEVAVVQRIHDSVIWIRRHRSDLYPYLLPDLIENLIIISNHEQLIEVVMGEVETARHLADLDPILRSLLHIGDPAVQRTFLIRAAELVGAEARLHPSRIVALADLVLNRPVGLPDTEEDVAATVFIVDRLLAKSRLSSMLPAVSLSASSSVIKSRLTRLAAQQRAVMQTTALTAAEKQRRVYQLQRQMTQLQTIRGVGVTYPSVATADAFPYPTSLLGGESFRTLQAIVDATRDGVVGDRIMAMLRTRAFDLTNPDAPNHGMALAAGLWWRGKQVEAAGGLDQLCELWPDHSELRLMAAEAHSHVEQLADTLYHLNRIKTTSAVINQRATDLRNDVFSRWSVMARRHQLPGHKGVIHSVSFSSDSRHIASAGVDRTVQIWSAEDGSLDKHLDKSLDMLLEVAFRPGTDLIAASGYDPRIQLSRVSTGPARPPLTRHTATVRGLVFSADGTRLATASEDGLVVVWSLDGDEINPLLTLTVEGVNALAISPNGSRLAMGCRNGSLVVRNLDLGGFELAAHDGPILDLAFSGSGNLLASSGTDRIVRLWNLDEKRKTSEWAPDGQAIRAVDLSTDGKWLVAAGNAGIVHLWDLAAEREDFAYSGHIGTVRSVAFSPDGKMIASAGNDGSIIVWKTNAKEELRRAAEH